MVNQQDNTQLSRLSLLILLYNYTFQLHTG